MLLIGGAFFSPRFADILVYPLGKVPSASEAISVIEEIQTGKGDTSDTNWGVLGACGVAVLLPILLLRRG